MDLPEAIEIVDSVVPQEWPIERDELLALTLEEVEALKVYFIRTVTRELAVYKEQFAEAPVFMCRRLLTDIPVDAVVIFPGDSGYKLLRLMEVCFRDDTASEPTYTFPLADRWDTKPEYSISSADRSTVGREANHYVENFHRKRPEPVMMTKRLSLVSVPLSNTAKMVQEGQTELVYEYLKTELGPYLRPDRPVAIVDVRVSGSSFKAISDIIKRLGASDVREYNIASYLPGHYFPRGVAELTFWEAEDLGARCVVKRPLVKPDQHIENVKRCNAVVAVFARWYLDHLGKVKEVYDHYQVMELIGHLVQATFYDQLRDETRTELVIVGAQTPTKRYKVLVPSTMERLYLEGGQFINYTILDADQGLTAQDLEGLDGKKVQVLIGDYWLKATVERVDPYGSTQPKYELKIKHVQVPANVAIAVKELE